MFAQFVEALIVVIGVSAFLVLCVWLLPHALRMELNKVTEEVHDDDEAH